MTAPTTTVQVLITFTPVELGLPDAETNVLLLLTDGSTCEGFYDGTEDDGRVIWRDVTADELDNGAVLAWADMPKGMNDPQQAAPAQPEPVARFCPGCGSVGDVPDTYRDCCPDGGDARVIPAKLAQQCCNLFRGALDGALAQDQQPLSNAQVSRLFNGPGVTATDRFKLSAAIFTRIVRLAEAAHGIAPVTATTAGAA